MAKRVHEIQSVFNKWLGMKARELAGQGLIKIIKSSDFPKGAPIHEDGSTEYDPMKPLVLFAIQITDTKGKRAWDAVLREFDELQAAA